MNKDDIKDLKDYPAFQKFQEFVIEKIDELRNNEDLINTENSKAGEMARVRGVVSIFLKDILSPFVDFADKSEPTQEQIKMAKMRAGL